MSPATKASEQPALIQFKNPIDAPDLGAGDSENEDARGASA
jgi:hypothetical protein